MNSSGKAGRTVIVHALPSSRAGNRRDRFLFLVEIFCKTIREDHVFSCI